MSDRYAHAVTTAEHRVLSIAKYRDKASGYDASARRTWPIRVRTIALLQLQPGQRVIDVGCGTGLSFELLRNAVGSQGEVAGIEHSPDMAALARKRIAAVGWRNVTVLETAVEDAQLSSAGSQIASGSDVRAAPTTTLFDAALCHYTHDILRSPQGVGNLVRQLKPGAHIAVAGMKYPPKWVWPLRWIARRQNQPYNGNYAALDTPWDILLTHTVDFSMRNTLFGTGYIAHCRTPQQHC